MINARGISYALEISWLTRRIHRGSMRHPRRSARCGSQRGRLDLAPKVAASTRSPQPDPCPVFLNFPQHIVTPVAPFPQRNLMEKSDFFKSDTHTSQVSVKHGDLDRDFHGEAASARIWPGRHMIAGKVMRPDASVRSTRPRMVGASLSAGALIISDARHAVECTMALFP